MDMVSTNTNQSSHHSKSSNNAETERDCQTGTESPYVGVSPNSPTIEEYLSCHFDILHFENSHQLPVTLSSSVLSSIDIDDAVRPLQEVLVDDHGVTAAASLATCTDVVINPSSANLFNTEDHLYLTVIDTGVTALSSPKTCTDIALNPCPTEILNREENINSTTIDNDGVTSVSAKACTDAVLNPIPTEIVNGEEPIIPIKQESSLITDASTQSNMVSMDGNERSHQSESTDSDETDHDSATSSSSSSSGTEEKEEESDDENSDLNGVLSKKEIYDAEEGEITNSENQEVTFCSDDEHDGKHPIKSKNEVDTLPTVPQVDVILQPHHQLFPIGVVLAVVDKSVVVNGLEKHSPLVEGTILWITETRSVLGFVDEVFGPVKNPYYTVRYNSEKDIPLGIHEGTAISFVDEFSESIIDVKALYAKGYDASGDNDEELDEMEFSDDEKEAEYNRSQRQAKRGVGSNNNPQTKKPGFQKNEKHKHPLKHKDPLPHNANSISETGHCASGLVIPPGTDNNGSMRSVSSFRPSLAFANESPIIPHSTQSSSFGGQPWNLAQQQHTTSWTHRMPPPHQLSTTIQGQPSGSVFGQSMTPPGTCNFGPGGSVSPFGSPFAFANGQPMFPVMPHATQSGSFVGCQQQLFQVQPALWSTGMAAQHLQNIGNPFQQMIGRQQNIGSQFHPLIDHQSHELYQQNQQPFFSSFPGGVILPQMGISSNQPPLYNFGANQVQPFNSPAGPMGQMQINLDQTAYGIPGTSRQFPSSPFEGEGKPPMQFNAGNSLASVRHPNSSKRKNTIWRK